MKKYFLAALGAVMISSSAFAQDDPNRMLVISQGGSYTSYAINNVDEVRFATVEGEVAAKIQINSFSLTELDINVQRTESCQSFLINVLPNVIAKQLKENPLGAEAQLKRANSPQYFQDFENGKLSGMELETGTEYAVVTLSYDQYNTPCQVETAVFTTEGPNIVGDPKVECTVTDSTLDTISFKFVPNNDVSKYYFVIGEKGTIQEQYDMFAPMYGFVNIGQLVQMWGGEGPGGETYEYTYKDLNPNTEYELYVQPCDVNGNFTDVMIINCSTAKKGGSGEAIVTITAGDYKLADWDGQMLPSQFFTYTPNDQTWCYRIGVYKEDQYNQEKDLIIEDLQSAPPMPAAYWFQYETLTTDYQIDPGVAVVAIASAKNADGIWGPVTELRYTTPATAPTSAPAKTAGRIQARADRTASASGSPRVPALGVRLSH